MPDGLNQGRAAGADYPRPGNPIPEHIPEQSGKSYLKATAHTMETF